MAKSSQQLSFESASKFAVVGASDVADKLGNLLFAACLEQHRDVVPVNSSHPTVQEHACLASLRNLSDPTHTAVFIAVGKSETLDVLQDAEAVGVPNIWLFTSGIDATSSQYLKTSGLESKSIISPDTAGPCKFVVPAFLRTPTSVSASVVAETSNALKRKSEDEHASSSPKKVLKTTHCNSLDDVFVKGKKFLAFPNFAVVGASNDLDKWGGKIFNCLKDKNLNVIPVNPNRVQVQGVDTIKTISELRDPKNTALSIVVRPTITLKVLEKAKEQEVPMIWIQPGAEDDAVREYITSAGLAERCVFTKPHSHSPILDGDNLVTMEEPDDESDSEASTDGGPVCREPSIIDAVKAVTEQATTSLVSNVKMIKPCLFSTLSALG